MGRSAGNVKFVGVGGWAVQANGILIVPTWQKNTTLDRSELILRMSGGIESEEFAQSLRQVFILKMWTIPKSSHTAGGEITGVSRM